jgi:TIR domain
MDVATPVIVYLVALAALLWGVVRFIRKRKAKLEAHVTYQVGQDRGTCVSDEAPGGPAQTTAHPIFISYRRSDSSDIVGRIYDRLVQHFGRENVFKDVDSIPLGVDYRKHLSDSIGQCYVVLAVIGKKWLIGNEAAQARCLENPRDFVRMEIESALGRNVPVIPVLVQGAVMPTSDELPPILESLVYHNAISVRSDPDFHQDVARLINGIEVHLCGKAEKVD